MRSGQPEACDQGRRGVWQSVCNIPRARRRRAAQTTPRRPRRSARATHATATATATACCASACRARAQDPPTRGPRRRRAPRRRPDRACGPRGCSRSASARRGLRASARITVGRWRGAGHGSWSSTGRAATGGETGCWRTSPPARASTVTSTRPPSGRRGPRCAQARQRPGRLARLGRLCRQRGEPLARRRPRGQAAPPVQRRPVPIHLPLSDAGRHRRRRGPRRGGAASDIGRAALRPGGR